MSEIETKTIDIDTVHPHPRNVRQGDIGAISQSLQAHGQFRAITYQKSTGRILAGNHTWKAAKALGWTKIVASAVVCDDDLYDGDDLDDLVFKLEGSLGFVENGLSMGELKDSYDNAEIRNLSLPYDREQIETIKQRLTELMKTTGATSFSDIVWDLVAKAL